MRFTCRQNFTEHRSRLGLHMDLHVHIEQLVSSVRGAQHPGMMSSISIAVTAGAAAQGCAEGAGGCATRQRRGQRCPAGATGQR